MKINKMPTTLALLIFSWLIAILGLIASGYLVILKPGGIKSLIIASSILLGSLLLAAIVRTIGNIGQMLFDLMGFLKESSYSFSKDLLNLNQDLKTQLQAQTTTLAQALKETKESLLNLNQDLKTQLQAQTTSLTSELQLLKNSLEQISCDSEDISQNINQIKTFFEQIEKHLDLKK